MTNNDTSHLIPKQEESMTNNDHTISSSCVNSDNTEHTEADQISYIIRAQKNKNNPYFQLNRHALRNPNLSLEAKGLFSYFMSLPDDWSICMKEVQKHSSNGRDAHRNALNELDSFGYAYQHRVRKNGKFIRMLIIIFEQPEFKAEYLKSLNDAASTPAPEKPFVVVSPRPEKPAPVNPSLQNNIYTKYGSIPNDHKKTTTGNIKGVVVSFLTDFGFSVGDASKLLREYGEQLIRDTMTMEGFKRARDRCGWLVDALKGRWFEKQSAPKPKSANPDIDATKALLVQAEKRQQEADEARRNGTPQKHLLKLKKNIQPETPKGTDEN